MAKMERFKAVIAVLQAKAAESLKHDQVSVLVGYTQNYAIYVHEDLTAEHKVGQAKYLEEPARVIQRDLASIVVNVKKRNGTMAQGLLLAGLRLQRESQLLVPVDTGALKASAFTRLEDNKGDSNGIPSGNSK